jgi:hypothetical protein
VHLDGPGRETELFRDLWAAEAVGDEPSDLCLPWAEGGVEREEALRRFATTAP